MRPRRVLTPERMRELTVEIILRGLLGARDRELAEVRAVIEETLAAVRPLPWLLSVLHVRDEVVAVLVGGHVISAAAHHRAAAVAEPVRIDGRTVPAVPSKPATPVANGAWRQIWSISPREMAHEPALVGSGATSSVRSCTCGAGPAVARTKPDCSAARRAVEPGGK